MDTSFKKKSRKIDAGKISDWILQVAVICGLIFLVVLSLGKLFFGESLEDQLKRKVKQDSLIAELAMGNLSPFAEEAFRLAGSWETTVNQISLGFFLDFFPDKEEAKEDLEILLESPFFLLESEEGKAIETAAQAFNSPKGQLKFDRKIFKMLPGSRHPEEELQRRKIREGKLRKLEQQIAGQGERKRELEKNWTIAKRFLVAGLILGVISLLVRFFFCAPANRAFSRALAQQTNSGESHD